ncbi:MAG: hypothetical protein INR62_02235 [Rhodospirillales bacterium]|nr:hypothetical protein [Acetobacter sp.]
MKTILGCTLLALGLSFSGVSRSWAEDNTVLYTNDFSSNPLDEAAGLKVNDLSAVSWAKEVTHSGKGSLKLTNGDKMKDVIAKGELIRFSGNRLTVSAEAKTENVAPGAQSWEKAMVQVYYYDENKRMIDYKWKGYNDMVPISTGTSGWSVYEKTFVLPEAVKAAYIQVRCVMLHTTGTAWIDKVTVTAPN